MANPFTMRIPLTGEIPDWPAPKAIRIIRPGQRHVVVPLLTERAYQIGRAETVELYFGDETVSRVHGFLYFDAVYGAWVYRDAGSTYGSALVDPQGEGPSEPIPQRQGTVVMAGHVVALGTGGSRIELLEDVPPEATGAQAVAWRSAAARALEDRIQATCQKAAPLVLQGPSGSGKTHAANRIHQLSGRRGRFVNVNCVNLPADPAVLRSELLGQAKGASPGSAGEPRPGQLALANGGTLFLDEVEALDWEAQTLLGEVLDGSAASRPDFRLISSTKDRLDQTALQRELIQKLGSGEHLQVPGLEERREDVPVLALRFLEDLAAEQQVDCELSADALSFLQEQKWPGQIRELRATVRMTALRSWWRTNSAALHARRHVVIGVQELRSYLVERMQGFGAPPLSVSPATPLPPSPLHPEPPPPKPPDALTREDLVAALRLAGQNQMQAAQALGISHDALRKKMEQLGL